MTAPARYEQMDRVADWGMSVDRAAHFKVVPSGTALSLLAAMHSRGRRWVKLGRADRLPGARIRGRCSSVSGPISGQPYQGSLGPRLCENEIWFGRNAERRTNFCVFLL